MISSITAATIASVVVLAAASENSFHAGPASSYPHQSSESIIVGAKLFDTPELVSQAFGKKIELLRYGVLPVLVIVENHRKQSVDLRALEISLVSADGRHASAVKAEDLQFLGTHGKHPSQVPLNIPLPKRKNSLARPELSDRAFVPIIDAPGESVSGFFYFEATPEAGDRIYVSGLQELPSGRELMYFEFPLSGASEAAALSPAVENELLRR